MGRGPLTFKQVDVTRALKAAIAAGIEVARVEIGRDGKIVMTTRKATERGPVQGGNEWDNP